VWCTSISPKKSRKRPKHSDAPNCRRDCFSLNLSTDIYFIELHHIGATIVSDARLSFCRSVHIMSNPTKAKRKGEEEEPAASEKKAKHPASASAAVAAEPIVRTTPTTLAIRRKLDAALNEAGGSGSLPVPDLINIIEAYYGSTFECGVMAVRISFDSAFFFFVVNADVFCGIPGVQADVRMGQSDALRGPTTVLALPAGSPFNAQHKDSPSLMIIDDDGMCTRQYYIGQDASTTTCELYSSLALSATLHGHVRRRHCRASCMCIDPSNPDRLFVGHSTGMDVVTVDVQSSKLTAECIADRPGIKSVIASLDGKKTFVADVCGQMFGIDVSLRDPIQLADDAYSLCWAVGPTVPPETMVYLTATGVICFFDVKSGTSVWLARVSFWELTHASMRRSRNTLPPAAPSGRSPLGRFE
jgi:hypothetical protein